MRKRIGNVLWKHSLRSDYRRFVQATKDARQTQLDLMQNILQSNQASRYGIAHNFDQIKTLETFRQLPITTYEDYQNYIDVLSNDQIDGVLTMDPPILLEPTSGSWSASKYIPYNRTLQSQFQKGINPWIYDLYRHKRIHISGSHYWSISPITEHIKTTKTGLPIGFEDDTAYLGGFARWIARQLFPVPSDVRFISDIQTFRYVTLLFLLRDADLSFVSVWSPTFFLRLLEDLDLHYDALVQDIQYGTISQTKGLSQDQLTLFQSKHRPNKSRAKQLSGLSAQKIHLIWPKLSVVSCWADADSASSKSLLEKRIHPIPIQPKGLIATECFVTFPLEHIGTILSIQSHFFEFLEVEPKQPKQLPYLCDELTVGHEYTMLITTGGGLYRYQMNDVVRVDGYYNQVPILTFVGRQSTSDHYGEKLNTRHVKDSIYAVFSKYNVTPTFCLMALVREPQPHYRLYVEGCILSSAVVNEIDVLLEENFHYKTCKHLEQLTNLDYQMVQDGYRIYTDYLMQSGRRLGDIKESVLSPHSDLPFSPDSSI